MNYFLLAALLLCGGFSRAQTYTSYFTGNNTDKIATPAGGICIMGGATESDDAMRWFLKRANGGDILILRASGSDGYNDYLYSELGIPVNSVESIVCHNAGAAAEPYIHQKIRQAEAIWFAGGDQWKYVSYWRNTTVDSLINDALRTRNIAIGGTSAGMAIQGKYYFSAQNGTVTSAAALANPYNNKVTVDSTRFIQNNYLQTVVTDTHYDNPDRKGRHIAFMARIFTDYGVEPKGITCEEYTAVCIDTNGLASVFGRSATSPDYAYFIQTNCELPNRAPEQCSPGIPLHWNLTESALAVYKIKGDKTGSNSFDLKDWTTGTGGEWENWWVENGVLMETSGKAIKCDPVSTETPPGVLPSLFRLLPNPAADSVRVWCENDTAYSIAITDLSGKVLRPETGPHRGTTAVDVSTLEPGIYLLTLKMDEGVFAAKLTVR